jgi:NAD(P)H-nitrite reductase large subunit
MSRRRLVIVGNGMGGARLVEDLLSRGGRELFEIAVYGDEPYGAYNRILLSSVLAGHHEPSDIVTNPPQWYAAQGVALHAGIGIDAVDTTGRIVRTSDGRAEPYDVLVFATGSRPFLPPIDGIEHALVFRCLDDCARILDRAKHSRRAVVIGGGLLGLEAARGLFTHGIDVHVVHLAPHLMETQLDEAGAEVLLQQLTALGIGVSTSLSATAIRAEGDRVTGVTFGDGSTLACELVVVAAGVRPAAELARRAGLTVARGIVVDDRLACSGADDVYAIGDCAEHRGRLPGLVAPAWEQARVLAERLTGRNLLASYAGTRVATKLKVAGVDLAVMGLKEPVEDDDEVVSYAEVRRGVYKKLIVRGDRIAGAIVIGDAAAIPRLTQAFHEAALLPLNRSEVLFPLIGGDPVPPVPAADLPDTAQICDCNAVSKRRIVEAVLAGARSLQAVRECTRASTGCGSCAPEVQNIIDFVCGGVDAQAGGPANTIEKIKAERDGLDVIADVPQLAGGGWEAIDEGNRERLKWGGVFFRRQTPGRFMMRVRMTNGLSNAEQVHALAAISEEFGTPVLDITTRQQIQVRGFDIGSLPEIWRRLEEAGLCSLQTGMDNIRNVIGCPVAGLTARELFDASPVVREFTNVFLKNKAFTNLPRKFNVMISGCTEHCTHAESQDLALTPALRKENGAEGGREAAGFNVAIGGKMGSGGCRVATPLDVFVTPGDAAALCAAIVAIFRDHGPRGARTKARLAFLLDDWGVAKFRTALEARLGRPLPQAGRDARVGHGADHLGVAKQKQAGLNSVGLAVPVGRLSAAQLHQVARLASTYGDGDVRFTTGQNVIVPNVPDDRLPALLAEPLLEELPHDPHGVMRGLVACTGIDYCHFALIETKEIAMRTARLLAERLPPERRVSMHWSGCPAGCGNHAAADVGLLGKNVRVGDELVDAVDIFVNGRMGPNPKPGLKVLEDVPCSDLPQVLEGIIPYVGVRTRGHGRA